MPLLEVDGLKVRFATPEREVTAVDGVDFFIDAGECVAIVGESGSGKSQTLLACTGLLAANGRVTGRVRFDGAELLGGDERGLEEVRGTGIGFVFQDAPGSLTPHLTVGRQLVEAAAVRMGTDRVRAREEALGMLERVHVPDAESRLRQYPHELSGGTRQRVAIAAALMPRPRLLIADEPTTALDVTVQAQVLELFRELRREFDMALVLVTHDLGVVAGLAERVIVMYAGRIVEEAPVLSFFRSPRHPYSAGLLEALPRLDDEPGSPMRTIPGAPPRPGESRGGCPFQPRCARGSSRCEKEEPALVAAAAGRIACHHPLDPGPNS
jgi:oligopeptide transport system ATP-binding protein